jgi:hypothetical protein
MRSWRALVVVVAAAAAALALSTSALAVGGGSSAASPRWKIRLGSATWSGRLTMLYPGVANDIERFPFTLGNGGRTSQRLRSVTVSIATTAGGDAETAAGIDIRGCRASWFAVSVDRHDRSLPAKLAPGETYNGRLDLSMRDSAGNQDACAGASPAFTLSAR